MKQLAHTFTWILEFTLAVHCLNMYNNFNYCAFCLFAGPLRGGGGNRGYLPGAPKLLRGFYFHDFYHCLDSMSEHLCRIISNAFMVSVDKLIDACTHFYMNN